MPALARGDIVLVPFPFTDLSTTKFRPATIVSGDATGGDLVLAFMSSVVPDPEGPFDVVIRANDPGFSATGLRGDAVLRMSKLVTLNRPLIRRRLGHLSAELLRRADEKLARALGLQE